MVPDGCAPLDRNRFPCGRFQNGLFCGRASRFSLTLLTGPLGWIRTSDRNPYTDRFFPLSYTRAT